MFGDLKCKWKLKRNRIWDHICKDDRCYRKHCNLLHCAARWLKKKTFSNLHPLVSFRYSFVFVLLDFDWRICLYCTVKFLSTKPPTPSFLNYCDEGGTDVCLKFACTVEFRFLNPQFSNLWIIVNNLWLRYQKS